MSLIRHLPIIILFQVTITVCSQMGSLGISIAGGKGSSPCKDNDEVHFITQNLSSKHEKETDEQFYEAIVFRCFLSKVVLNVTSLSL